MPTDTALTPAPYVAHLSWPYQPSTRPSVWLVEFRLMRAEMDDDCVVAYVAPDLADAIAWCRSKEGADWCRGESDPWCFHIAAHRVGEADFSRQIGPQFYVDADGEMHAFEDCAGAPFMCGPSHIA